MHMNPQNGEIQINTLRLIYLYQNRLFLSNEDDIKSSRRSDFCSQGSMMLHMLTHYSSPDAAEEVGLKMSP